MALITKGGDGTEKGGKAGQMDKQKGLVEERILKPNEVEVKVRYVDEGKECTKSIVVPKSLIAATADPGESSMHPIEAMDALARFNEEVLGPGIAELSIDGGVDMPTAVVSEQVRHAYEVHATCASQNKQVRDSLFLEDPDVQKRLRSVAAMLCGVEESQIRELSFDETMVWVDRTVTTVMLKPAISMQRKKVMCDRGSHPEPREVSVPVGTTVEEAREMAEQRLARLPEVRNELERTFSLIEEKRGGPLSPSQRDAVVQHMNMTYIPNANDRLPVTPHR